MTKTNFLRGMTLAIICATSMLFAQVRDFAFPSPLPPHGNAADVKQIVSIIWDDNAYSGVTGTSYEATPGATYANIQWVGGQRVEPGWVTTGPNSLNIKEGDMGMSWAAYKLAGTTIPENPPVWSLAVENWSANNLCSFEGNIYRATGWMGRGSSPATHNAQNKCTQTPWGTQCEAHWVLVGPMAQPQRVKTNPDGSPISFTFNVITGLFTAVSPVSWQSRESRFGYYQPNAAMPGEHTRIAVAWGRENVIYSNLQTMLARGTAGIEMPGTIEAIFRRTLALGHEIGNHTIDHLESNSPLPNTVANPYRTGVTGVARIPGFGRWGGEGMAEGGRISTSVMPDGQQMTVDQVTHFGQTPGHPWQFMGWENQAGRVISVNAWRGLIELGEEELQQAFPGLKPVGFRAPRLEVNTNMFHALRSLGYWYDTGNEEGYEYNVDGTNFLWPYTMDNGSPNMAWQRMVGSNRSSWDSLPSGLWQYPVSVFIIPENHRATLWNNYVAITTGAADGTTPTEADRQHFLRVGKVTGFDFNLFILKGATREIATATMRHSLDQRMRGGKAPFQVGAHTDYFTPIYDNATLLNTLNAPSYGLNVTRGWNTWRDRIAVFEDFVDYGLGRGAHFLSGEETIKYMRELTNRVRIGAEKRVLSNWTFFSHSQKSTLTAGNLATGADITTVQDASARDLEITGFAVYGNAGDFVFDHISLEYSTTAPITIRLITNNPIDQSFPYEVTLSNLNGFNNWDGSREVNKNRFVNSREIPLSAFQRNQYVGAPEETRPEIRNWIGLKSPSTEFARTITGIEISVQVPLVSSFQWRQNAAGMSGIMNRVQNQRNWVAVRNFTLHSGEQVPPQQVGVTPVATKGAQRIAIMGMTNNSLKLNMVHSGTYNVDVVSVNGRVVKSFKDVNLNMGVNTLPLNNLSKGMYMIRIRNNQVNTTLKSLVI